jgi:hypothetical protein
LANRLYQEHYSPKARKGFWAYIRIEKEFWYYVLALDDHRKKHLKVKKIPLVNWHGLDIFKDIRVCTGCRQAAALKERKYCAKCARLAYRMKRARFPRNAVNAL